MLKQNAIDLPEIQNLNGKELLSGKVGVRDLTASEEQERKARAKSKSNMGLLVPNPRSVATENAI